MWDSALKKLGMSRSKDDAPPATAALETIYSVGEGRTVVVAVDGCTSCFSAFDEYLKEKREREDRVVVVLRGSRSLSGAPFSGPLVFSSRPRGMGLGLLSRKKALGELLEDAENVVGREQCKVRNRVVIPGLPLTDFSDWDRRTRVMLAKLAAQAEPFCARFEAVRVSSGNREQQFAEAVMECCTELDANLLVVANHRQPRKGNQGRSLSTVFSMNTCPVLVLGKEVSTCVRTSSKSKSSEFDTPSMGDDNGSLQTVPSALGVSRRFVACSTGDTDGKSSRSLGRNSSLEKIVSLLRSGSPGTPRVEGDETPWTASGPQRALMRRYHSTGAGSDAELRVFSAGGKSLSLTPPVYLEFEGLGEEEEGRIGAEGREEEKPVLNGRGAAEEDEDGSGKLESEGKGRESPREPSWCHRRSSSMKLQEPKKKVLYRAAYSAPIRLMQDRFWEDEARGAGAGRPTAQQVSQQRTVRLDEEGRTLLVSRTFEGEQDPGGVLTGVRVVMSADLQGGAEELAGTCPTVPGHGTQAKCERALSDAETTASRAPGKRTSQVEASPRGAQRKAPHGKPPKSPFGQSPAQGHGIFRSPLALGGSGRSKSPSPTKAAAHRSGGGDGQKASPGLVLPQGSAGVLRDQEEEPAKEKSSLRSSTPRHSVEGHRKPPKSPMSASAAAKGLAAHSLKTAAQRSLGEERAGECAGAVHSSCIDFRAVRPRPHAGGRPVKAWSFSGTTVEQLGDGPKGGAWGDASSCGGEDVCQGPGPKTSNGARRLLTHRRSTHSNASLPEKAEASPNQIPQTPHCRVEREGESGNLGHHPSKSLELPSFQNNFGGSGDRAKLAARAAGVHRQHNRLWIFFAK